MPEKIDRVNNSNHKSALDHKLKVEKRLLEEIEDGNYIKVHEDNVKLISPLEAIEKSDGDVRVIHDLSFAKQGQASLNSHASKEECYYESLEDTISNIRRNMWMAKCDLKWAYRSVGINPDQ